MILTVAVILASVGLLVSFFLFYHDGNASLVGEFCDDCDQFGRRTQTCVDDCDDECCFTDTSEPLAIAFVAAVGLSLVASVVGLGTAVAHLCFAFRLSSQPRKRL